MKNLPLTSLLHIQYTSKPAAMKNLPLTSLLHIQYTSKPAAMKNLPLTSLLHIQYTSKPAAMKNLPLTSLLHIQYTSKPAAMKNLPLTSLLHIQYTSKPAAMKNLPLTSLLHIQYTSKPAAMKNLPLTSLLHIQYTSKPAAMKNLPLTSLLHIQYTSKPAAMKNLPLTSLLHIQYTSKPAAMKNLPLTSLLHIQYTKTCLNVMLPHIQEGRYKNVQYTQHESNKGEWIRQVRYSQYLECFISCASTSHNSMVIGWMEKHSAVAQPKIDSKIMKVDKAYNKELILQSVTAQNLRNTQVSKEILRTAGIDTTAGVNHHVCLWNPYVVSKPNGVLRGHMASVIQVQFIKSRNQLISFSKDKVLRIWDVQLQVCIQRVAGMFPKGPEVITTLYFDESKDRNGTERNRLLITFNYQLCYMEMKLEIRDRVMSHDKPVLAAIYNQTFNQVISVCQSGTIIVWMIDTGQKVKQFNHTHGSSEVTCLAQDAQETKFFTGSTDGTVKIWDYNGHCYHTLDCAGGQPADVGQILNLKRSVVVVGLAKNITVFRDSSFKEHTVEPDIWKGQSEHVEDILCAAHTTPHQLATGSYDGEIVIWNSNSEIASKHLRQRAKKRESEKTFITITREELQMKSDTLLFLFSYVVQTTILPDSAKSRPKSRPVSRRSMAQESDQEGTGFMVSRLVYLDARKTNSAGNGANLMSCGGNGWVRFWNTNTAKLMAEFVAHQNADVDGVMKVWDILEYCTCPTDEIITDAPPLKTTFSPHVDMINALLITERNGRMLVVSASSDCSVVLSDIYGNRIGVFGQSVIASAGDISICEYFYLDFK
ncbi:hypothetical protein KUTeg_008979, partial [Tegillarca granosa]